MPSRLLVALVLLAETTETVAYLRSERGESAESIGDDQPCREAEHSACGEVEQPTRLRVVVPITQRRHYHAPVAEDVGLR